ncbi:hypothetical protein [Sorangium cellulosum]|uniref:hypothetical protein n=1 Tax=Sorangium cellulosum TaxID=56 RepID=UPI0018F86DA7|nr:hypothetical protein [Sorangium cellulosum]
MAETQRAEVCTRELDVDQPSAQQVETCVIDAQGTMYAVTLGDRAELQAPDDWFVLVRGNDGSYTSDGFPMHRAAHEGPRRRDARRERDPLRRFVRGRARARAVARSPSRLAVSPSVRRP